MTQPCFDNIGAEDVKLFLLKQAYKSFLFLYETMDIFCLAGSGYSSRRRGTWDGKSIIHPRNLWVRGSNLTGGHDRLSCPRSADTALKPYLNPL